MADQYKVYEWDDEINDDGGESLESVVLPDGNYPFEVIKVEKSWYDGSDKMPPCNMAKVFLRVDGGSLGKALCVENIYLYEKMEWKAAAFLRSIGLKKHGEPIKWNQLNHCDGETGRCRVYTDSYTGRDNQTRKSNKVEKYFDKEEQQPKKSFTRGSF